MNVPTMIKRLVAMALLSSLVALVAGCGEKGAGSGTKPEPPPGKSIPTSGGGGAAGNRPGPR